MRSKVASALGHPEAGKAWAHLQAAEAHGQVVQPTDAYKLAVQACDAQARRAPVIRAARFAPCIRTLSPAQQQSCRRSHVPKPQGRRIQSTGCCWVGHALLQGKARCWSELGPAADAPPMAPGCVSHTFSSRSTISLGLQRSSVASAASSAGWCRSGRFPAAGFAAGGRSRTAAASASVTLSNGAASSPPAFCSSQLTSVNVEMDVSR